MSIQFNESDFANARALRAYVLVDPFHTRFSGRLSFANVQPAARLAHRCTVLAYARRPGLPALVVQSVHVIDQVRLAAELPQSDVDRGRLESVRFLLLIVETRLRTGVDDPDHLITEVCRCGGLHCAPRFADPVRNLKA
jgi:hypothetical protein